MTASNVKSSMGLAEWSMVVLLSLLWGGSFFLVGVAVKELPTFLIVTCRVGLAACVLWAILIVSGTPIPRKPAIWFAFLCMGFLNNAVPFSLIVWSQGHIPSGLASILNATTPLFTVVVAHFLTTDERMNARKWIGVALGLAGVIVLIGVDALRALGVGVLAQLAVLGAAISYAFAAVYGRRFRAMDVAPVTTATGQVTMSSLILLPVMLYLEEPWRLPAPSLGTVAAVGSLGVFATALAYILYFRILAAAGATNLAVVTFLIPVSAIILGTVFLEEVLAARHFAGMALIGLGLAFMDGRLIRFPWSRP